MTDLPKKCVAEAIGTFMLCFVGAGAIVSNEPVSYTHLTLPTTPYV